MSFIEYTGADNTGADAEEGADLDSEDEERGITGADVLDLLNAEEIGADRTGNQGDDETFELEIQNAPDPATGGAGVRTMRSKIAALEQS